ncbi:MAG: UDP-N-acetylglucosamine--N-acetylmuramyl-(pentapeptide) pyrophosphoryl-undecaprenol N-acetylglucosamine transferase [Pseudomonadota bacterium]
MSASEAHIKSTIALAAGGTGGHMFPAESLAQELGRRGHEIVLVTDNRGARYANDFPCAARFEISAATPSVGGPIAKAAAAFSIAGGLFTSLRRFKELGVDAVVGFGGYPSLPAVKAADILKLPYGLHEQNGVLGRTNRLLEGNARFLAHGFSNLAKSKRTSRLTEEVGNPIRDAVKDLVGVSFTAPVEGEQIRLLIFGGSQGAAIFSRVVAPALEALAPSLRNRLSVLQQAREAEADEIKAVYARCGIDAEIAPFFSDLPDRMAKAHLIISRSGASTVSEISAVGRPSILVPLKIAMDDHQTGNAKALTETGGAILLPEDEFTPSALTEVLSGLLQSPQRLTDMASRAKGRVKSNAAARLAELVEANLMRTPNVGKAA